MAIVDRAGEIATIRSLLLADEVRLLTLTGPGGVGKTRLALEVGADLARHFAGGLVFVDLSPVRNPNLVLQALAQSLSANDVPADESLLEWLNTNLQDRTVLIVLDNAEHVLSGASRLAELLLGASQVTLLVTSREALHLRWEFIYPLPALALPNLEPPPPLAELGVVPSVALFLQRARAINQDFSLTEDNAPAVSELVVRLDGLPLAIELAAARTSLLSPQMIVERLGQRLSLLRWQARDLPQRQQTLRSAIAWSYDLLSPEEQTLFRHLGIFEGSFSLRAAEAIAEYLRIDSLDSLASLVDKSLIQVHGRDQDAVRYVVLESMREYARERLVDAGELEEAGRIHALYYVALAERAEPELTGPGQEIWFVRLQWAHENLRAALRWLLDHDEGELALRLATSISGLWEAHGHFTEGQQQLEEALARTPAVEPSLLVKALTWLGTLLLSSADQMTDPDRSRALERAASVLAEALDVARSIQDPLRLGHALTCIGMLHIHLQQWTDAHRALGEAQATWQEARYPWGVASTLLSLGAVELMRGNYEEAARLAEESAANHRDLGDESARTTSLLVLLAAAGAQSEGARREAVVQELLALSERAPTPPLRALCSAGVAWLFREQEDPERLARLLGAVDATQRATDLAGRMALRMYVAATSETLQIRIGREAFDAALAKGRSLSCGQALREVLRVTSPRECVAKRARCKILSAREQDVLHLVAQGLSNKQIAKGLIVAPSTVAYHLTSIYNKLGVDTRAQAVAVAAARDLVILHD